MCLSATAIALCYPHVALAVLLVLSSLLSLSRNVRCVTCVQPWEVNGCNLTEQYLRAINAVYEEDYLPKMAYALCTSPATLLLLVLLLPAFTQ